MELASCLQSGAKNVWLLHLLENFWTPGYQLFQCYFYLLTFMRHGRVIGVNCVEFLLRRLIY